MKENIRFENLIMITFTDLLPQCSKEKACFGIVANDYINNDD